MTVECWVFKCSLIRHMFCPIAFFVSTFPFQTFTSEIYQIRPKPSVSLSSSIPGEVCLGTMVLRRSTSQYVKQRHSSKDCLGLSVPWRQIFARPLQGCDFELWIGTKCDCGSLSDSGDQPLRFGPYKGYSVEADWTQIGSESIVPEQNLANTLNSLFISSSFTVQRNTCP